MSATIDDVVAATDFGRPSAQKRGRNPQWPYVPVILHDDRGIARQEQILARAFATRDEAVAHAERVIRDRRTSLAHRLALPSHRALREQYGLPRDFPPTP